MYVQTESKAKKNEYSFFIFTIGYHQRSSITGSNDLRG